MEAAAVWHVAGHVVEGRVGLWGRVHVAVCPFCGEAHYHDDEPEPGDVRRAPCGGGIYKIVTEVGDE